jgi:hypothetical protein
VVLDLDRALLLHQLVEALVQLAIARVWFSGLAMSSISPLRWRSRITFISSRISARTFSCSSMMRRSASMSLVPMTRVPLNIMCSKRWLMPVMPSRSFTEPTWATHPPTTVGESWRSKSSQRIPFGSVNSCTLICGFSAAPAGRGRRARRRRRAIRRAAARFM